MTHPDSPSVPTSANALLQAVGERSTPARRAVLEILLATPTALSHAEIAAAARVAGNDLDRVTLYRVLDWLVEKALAHKIAGEDRVWRFNATSRDGHAPRGAHEHAHFHCSQCGRLFCLDQLQPVFAFSLPPGFVCEHAELTLRGRCSDCGSGTGDGSP
jgi:Fur family transcriptional regulator, ferric uptake regulator